MCTLKWSHVVVQVNKHNLYIAWHYQKISNKERSCIWWTGLFLPWPKSCAQDIRMSRQTKQVRRLFLSKSRLTVVLSDYWRCPNSATWAIEYFYSPDCSALSILVSFKRGKRTSSHTSITWSKLAKWIKLRRFNRTNVCVVCLLFWHCYQKRHNSPKNNGTGGSIEMYITYKLVLLILKF